MLAVGAAILLASMSAQAFEYPWFTYGNLSNYSGGNENPGTKFDGYIEQGVDWYQFHGNGPILNTFLGMNGTFSDKSDRWWDNMWGPALGVKVKLPIKLSEFNGGEVAVGVRGEHFEYTGGAAPVSNENRVVVFVQWYFGGKNFK